MRRLAQRLTATIFSVLIVEVRIMRSRRYRQNAKIGLLTLGGSSIPAELTAVDFVAKQRTCGAAKDLSDIVNVEGRSTKGQDRKSGVPVMSDIPRDLQRRCERRWAARFARPVPASASHEHTDEKPDQQLARLAKPKKTTSRLNPAGLKSAPAV